MTVASDNTIFELKHVSYRYRPHEPALLDINLTVAEGEKIVILGPNGAGKTTLEKLLAGILPAEGRLRAFGKPMTAQEIQSRTLAGSLESGIHPFFTCRDQSDFIFPCRGKYRST